MEEKKEIKIAIKKEKPTYDSENILIEFKIRE